MNNAEKHLMQIGQNENSAVRNVTLSFSQKWVNLRDYKTIEVEKGRNAQHQLVKFAKKHLNITSQDKQSIAQENVGRNAILLY